MSQLKFTTKLTGDGSSMSVIEIPKKVMASFGGRTRVRVKARLNGFQYRTTIFSTGGCVGIPVRREIRENSGIEPGKNVRVVLEEDLDVRTVSIPSDLLRALKCKRDLYAKFKRLSYTHQKEFVNWVTAAKKAETRVARISKTIEKLGAARPPA